MAGTGMSIGAMFGPWGAAIGAGVGALVGLFMGDPKKKVDKKENMPKLQKGFTDAMQQLRDLLGDRNALFGDPEGAVAKAMEIRGAIASGFGIEFQSKKYKKEAAKLIASKLIEADQLIKQIKEMADMARAANSVNTRLEAEFATGVFADRAFIRQHTDFKRRNGLLAGGWTGRDTLPSMLAAGEMVLNPKQIDRVRSNAGFDAFRGAGIPNYAAGTFVGPSSSVAPVAANTPVTVQIVLNNSGIVESDIKGVLVNGLKQPDVQVELVKAYDKGKTRTR
jgi:gas vesicle protein